MRPRSALLWLVLPLLASAAWGQEKLLLSGGELADHAYYGYVGTVLPLGARRDGRGFVQRYWLDRFGYEYEGAPGRIRARAWGAEAALGYAVPWADGWAAASLGLRHTDTELSPEDPSAEARGSQTGLKLQLEGERSLGRGWRAAAIASWSDRQDAYWARLRLMRPLGTGHRAGAELVAGGNDESRARAAGVVWSLTPGTGPWSFSIKGGYRREHDGAGAYGGLELGYSF